MERYGGGLIAVCDYDPMWSVMFEQERARVHGRLGSMVTTIEHIGSTAVPGLAAKPIIDLLVGVRSLAEARSCCIEPLQGLSYTYVPEYESWLPAELFFRKGIPGPWTHHVHMMEPSASGERGRRRRRNQGRRASRPPVLHGNVVPAANPFNSREASPSAHGLCGCRHRRSEGSVTLDARVDAVSARRRQCAGFPRTARARAGVSLTCGRILTSIPEAMIRAPGVVARLAVRLFRLALLAGRHDAKA